MVPDFIRSNGEWSYRYIILGRLLLIPFSCLGAWACYRWANELYGGAAALLATALWCLSPNELALASLMSPDGVASSLGIVAAYGFWRWLVNPSWSRAAIAGVWLGMALLTKLTWIVLLALWPVLAFIIIATHRQRSGLSVGRSRMLQLGLCIVLSLHVLNMGYLYDGTFKALGDFRFVSRTLTGKDLRSTGQRWGNRFSRTILAHIPVPVPEQFVVGLDVQKGDFEIPRRTYFRGRMYDHGLWYYYLYALLVKTPAGVFVVSCVALARACNRSSAVDRAWILPAHFLVVVGVVSAELSWNAHSRYALPAIPFLFVWTSRAARVFSAGRRTLSAVLAAGMAWACGSSLYYCPHSLSYFNEFAGGPKAGHLHLIDSNVDWGQDLFDLKDWLDRHPEVGKIGLVYYGQFNPQVAGIDFFLPEDNPNSVRSPGWYAVSVSMMHGIPFWQTSPSGEQQWCRQDGFVDFLHRDPVDRVGYSILIFHVT